MEKRERPAGPDREGTPPGERLVTARELAEALGVSVHTIYRMTGREGGLPGYKVGRLTRYKPSEVAAYLEGRRVKAPEEGGPFPNMARFRYTPGMKVVEL